MCLPFSLFSDPVRMVELVPGLLSRVPGVISAISRSNICLFLFVPDLYFLILYYCMVATWKF